MFSVELQRRIQEFLKGRVVNFNNLVAIGVDGERRRRELLGGSGGHAPLENFSNFTL